jgi:hypothetical protein
LVKNGQNLEEPIALVGRAMDETPVPHLWLTRWGDSITTGGNTTGIKRGSGGNARQKGRTQDSLREFNGLIKTPYSNLLSR